MRGAALLKSDADCVIVGGGIGGAVLALALGRAGRHALILERGVAPASHARPEILAGATLETFRRLGIGERIAREACQPLAGLEVFESGGRTTLFRVTRDDLQHVQANPQSTDPAATRRMILEAASRTGRVTSEQVEVQGLLSEGGRVSGVQALKQGAPVEYRAPLTVADDGTHSTLRTAMGATVQLRAFPFDFLGAVVPRLPEQASDEANAWINVRGMRRGLFAGLFLPIPGHRTALVFGLSPAAWERFQAAPDTFAAAAIRLAPPGTDPTRLPNFPEGYGHFRRPFGHASRYVGDGIALIGDAAHPVTPAGGQGANMSVADAMVLAEVAVEALRSGDCSAQQLGRYEAVRRPANARSLQFSERPSTVFRLLQAAPFLAPLLLSFIRSANRRPDVKQRFIGGVARAFVSGYNER